MCPSPVVEEIISAIEDKSIGITALEDIILTAVANHGKRKPRSEKSAGALSRVCQ